MRIVRKSLELMPYQGLYFSLMNNGQVVPLFPDCASPVVKEGASVIVMAGIASPRPFLEAIKTKYHVEGTLMFADHHAYRMRDLDMMLHALDEAPEGTVIITTEKDAVKLTNRARIPERIQRSLYFIPVYIDFFDCKENEFIEKIEKYVATNHKYSLVHSH